jgi:Predicted sugar kinase
MIFALFCNDSKPHAISLGHNLVEFLVSQGHRVVMPDSSASLCRAESLSAVSPSEISFRLSLGGDGTILRLLHAYPEIKAPLVGINMGSLGFLADVPAQDVYPCLQDLIQGHYVVEKRLMLEGRSQRGESFFALNDIVFHRASNPSIIELGVHVDQTYLNTFSADGIIIATPTGSTAYSLAAGGPIVSPDIQACLITPISPHTVSNRPMILFPKTEIQVQYLSDKEPIEVIFDGLTPLKLESNEVFRISIAPEQFLLVKFPHHDYFSTLRGKLGWSGKLR